MFAWILNTKPVILPSSAFTVRLAAACARGLGANSASASMSSLTPKSLSALPNRIGVRWPSRKACLIEALQALDREMELVERLGALVLGQKRSHARIVGAGDCDRLGVLAERDQALAADVVSAGKRAAAADGPVERRGVERQRLLDFVDEIERIARLAVHLVDEGDDRNVAQPADLEELAGARLDALGGVDHHHRRIDGGQRAIGVLGKVLVAGGVEQIEDASPVFEGHDRGHDGNAALALDAHPVRARLAAVRLGAHFAGELDRAAEQQHLLGQRRLAGVRVRDDREGAPARDGVRVRTSDLEAFGEEAGLSNVRRARGEGLATSGKAAHFGLGLDRCHISSHVTCHELHGMIGILAQL